MRILGLDYGDVRIGVAVSDELGFTAQGVEVIRRTTVEEDFQKIQAVIDRYSPSAIVLGLPKNMNGTIGHRGELTKEFAAALESRFVLPVILWDERLTTVAAEKMLIDADVSRRKRKNVVDKIAAMFILQNYLDSRG